MYSNIKFLNHQIYKLFILGVAILIAACADDIEKLKLSEDEKVRIFQLQNPFGENHVSLAVPGEAQQIRLGLKECSLYRANVTQGVVTEWVAENALRVFYPMWSVCTQESLKLDGQYISLHFCKTPLGAGGGCAAGGGNFRSLNGKNWQLLGANGKWGKFVKGNDK